MCIWQISHKKATIAASITTKAEGTKNVPQVTLVTDRHGKHAIEIDTSVRIRFNKTLKIRLDLWRGLFSFGIMKTLARAYALFASFVYCTIPIFKGVYWKWVSHSLFVG